MHPNPTTTGPAFEPGRPITELVVPVVAGSLHDRVVPLVARMAHTWSLPIQLVHVSASVSSVDVDLEAVADGMRSWYPDVEVHTKHLYGDDPATAIADHASVGALVAMSTDHIDRWRVKGSVAEAVLEHLGGPAVVVGPHVTKDRMRSAGLDGEVVVGVDGSAGAEAGVGPAAALAAAIDHGMWLVRVTPEPTADEPLHPEIGRELQALAERWDGDVTTRWEVVQSNDPVTALEAFAERRDAAFLVVSTAGRTATSRHSMASIASGLASTAARPVMIVPTAEVPTLDQG